MYTFLNRFLKFYFQDVQYITNHQKCIKCAGNFDRIIHVMQASDASERLHKRSR